MPSRRGLFLSLLFPCLACGASSPPEPEPVTAKDFLGFEATEAADPPKSAKPTPTTNNPGVNNTRANNARADYVLRSVRPDLRMAATATPDTRCRCIDAVADTHTGSKFTWTKQTPRTSPEQLLVAFRTEGSRCDASGPRRPSIQAVDRRGADVIVVIEELPAGRPLAQGAIVQQPGAGGALYLRPRNAKLPYAQPKDGQQLNKGCRVYQKEP